MKTHLLEDNGLYTACGIDWPDKKHIPTTRNPEEVNCYSCTYTDYYEKKIAAIQEDDSKENRAIEKQVGGRHYKDFEIQPATFVFENEDYLHPSDAVIIWNVLKYLVRHRKKDNEKDLDKAIHYIELLKDHTYNDKS